MFQPVIYYQNYPISPENLVFSTEGGAYATVYLLKAELAGLESNLLELPEDKVLRMKLSEPTQGIITKVCLDTPTSCPYRTPGVLLGDAKTWKTVSYRIPRGTRKVEVVDFS